MRARSQRNESFGETVLLPWLQFLGGSLTWLVLVIANRDASLATGVATTFAIFCVSAAFWEAGRLTDGSRASAVNVGRTGRVGIWLLFSVGSAMFSILVFYEGRVVYGELVAAFLALTFTFHAIFDRARRSQSVAR